MIRKLAALKTVYEWADRWLTDEYMISRYTSCAHHVFPVYDVNMEIYIQSWWMYLS